jgi:hypothetical protein
MEFGPKRQRKVPSTRAVTILLVVCLGSCLGTTAFAQTLVNAWSTGESASVPQYPQLLGRTDPRIVISAESGSACFAASYKPEGTLRWVKTILNFGACNGIAVDKPGTYVYVTGGFSGQESFGTPMVMSLPAVMERSVR